MDRVGGIGPLELERCSHEDNGLVISMRDHRDSFYAATISALLNALAQATVLFHLPSSWINVDGMSRVMTISLELPLIDGEFRQRISIAPSSPLSAPQVSCADHANCGR
jgi:hypothetical protein